MIVTEPYRHTKLEIWTPRYHDEYSETGDKVALLAKYKVDHASPLILVAFTKAKHLAGQRFCIHRSVAQGFPVESNSKIPCYVVPMSAFDTWISQREQMEQDIATA